jgi:hypothetical protein
MLCQLVELRLGVPTVQLIEFQSSLRYFMIAELLHRDRLGTCEGADDID